MKKLLIAVSVMLLTMGAASAQNSFRGIVKYQLESTGKVDVKIPAEQSIVEVKVYDNQIRLGQTTQNGFKVALIRDETSKEKLDSGYIVDTEPGHYYYENADETKEILGYTAKKLIMHRYDEEGNDNPAICWYTTEIGPEYCILLGSIKGFPLVFTQEAGEGRAITYTATEIIKGKVKEVDMLLPAGYKDASGEEFETFQRELKDAIELLED